MLNSNYFSKRAFTQNLQVFNLWLEQQYNISCSQENELFTKQVHFYNSYIKFLNYREKYIQDKKKVKKNSKSSLYSLIIFNELLKPLDIYINK